MCLDEESPELLLEDALSDSISRKDGGFLPGLRPRDHGEVLGAVFAGGLDEQEAERLLHDLMSRRQPAPAESEEPPEADESSFGDRASAASGQEAVDPGPGDLETPAPPPTPESRRNVRRLEAARREVGAFEPRNAYQAELRTVLFAIMDHMSRLALSGRTSRKHCEPGEEADCERWWAVLEVYRTVLAAPEMAAASARTVLPKVLELEHRQLTERRLEWALGRRKRKTRARKKKRKKKRRRRRKRKRRSRKPRTNSQQGNRT